MIVICNGMPRSASTWSFNITLSLIGRCFPGETVHGGYDENVAQFLGSAAAGTRHLVLKCRTLDGVGRTLSRAGAVKVVYTWRDVADAVVSSANMFGGDFETILETMRGSLELYRFHRQTGNAAILRYDEIIGDPRKAVGQVGRYLGLGSLATGIIDGVAQENSLERTRERVERMDTGDEGERLVTAGNSAYDPQTLLHRRHIRNGRSGDGRRILSAGQLARIDVLMREYGLPGE
jgi:hypothetical protein